MIVAADFQIYEKGIFCSNHKPAISTPLNYSAKYGFQYLALGQYGKDINEI